VVKKITCLPSIAVGLPCVILDPEGMFGCPEASGW
jgi:hypothetical protein